MQSREDNPQAEQAVTMIATEKARLEQEAQWSSRAGHISLTDLGLKTLTVINQENLTNFLVDQLVEVFDNRQVAIDNALQQLTQKRVLAYNPNSKRYNRLYSASDEVAIITYENIRRKRMWANTQDDALHSSVSPNNTSSS